MTIELRRESSFLPTKAHARFVEFAEACAQARYIGICHGRPGVGKTRSAREYAAWPGLLDYSVREQPTDAQADAIRRCKALFSTATVANTPKSIQAALGISLVRWGHARLVLEGRLNERDCLHLAEHACPLLIMDEADRLSLKSLEHLRDLYDRYGFGLILIGMPGLEKRLARYPSSTRGSASCTNSNRSARRKPGFWCHATAPGSASASIRTALSISRPWPQ